MTKNGFYFIGIISILLFSCKNGTNGSNIIPDVPVNVRIVLNDNNYTQLRIDGGYVYLNNVGYRGILLYRNNATTYTAFDRASPYAPDKACSIITMSPSRISLEDTCSQSIFDLQGNLIGGPAPGPLKKYYTEIWNGYELRILNAPY